VYHDLQSLKEDDVVVAMLESKGRGKWLGASPRRDVNVAPQNLAAGR
jgi:hypothetical protein